MTHEQQSSPTAAAPCDCAGSQISFDDEGPGVHGPPVLLALQEIKAGFRVRLTGEDAPDREAIGACLLSAGRALERLAEALEELSDDERGRKAKLALRLVEAIASPAAFMQHVGGGLLGRSPAEESGAGKELASQAAGDLVRASNLLARVGRHEIFGVYGELFGSVATALGSLLQATAGGSDEERFSAAVGASYEHCSQVCRAAFVQLAGLIILAQAGGAGAAAAAGPCPPGCPFQGGYTFCRDEFRGPTGCTTWTKSKWTDNWYTTCTWTVTRVSTTLVFCYASRWDRFWAQNCCARFKTATVLSVTTVSKETGVYSPYGAPTAPPRDHWESC